MTERDLSDFILQERVSMSGTLGRDRLNGCNHYCVSSALLGVSRICGYRVFLKVARVLLGFSWWLLGLHLLAN